MTTKSDNLVDASTVREIVSLVKGAIAGTQALHELISDAGRIVVLNLPLSTSLAILRTQRVRNRSVANPI
jgi:hypothetical protein